MSKSARAKKRRTERSHLSKRERKVLADRVVQPVSTPFEDHTIDDAIEDAKRDAVAEPLSPARRAFQNL